MNKNIKILLSIIAFVLFIFGIQSITYAASDFTLENLNFDVVLLENGDMNVTETWSIDIDGETNTLFKTFILDSSKYDGIVDVKVEEVDEYGKTMQQFKDINQEMYHVTTNCFYALENSDGDFEIAWGINKSSGDKYYKISYTVENVVKVYNDCSELYWQFIGEDFEVDANKVTGTITLPNAVEDIDDLRVWAHGPLNGDIRRKDSKTVTFSIEPFDSGRFVEVRIATLENIFPLSVKVLDINKLDEILDEENEWANKANEEREKIKNRRKIANLCVLIVAAILSVIYVSRILKNYKKLKGTTKLEPTTKLEYFRDIPDESASQAEVAFLHYFSGNTLSMHMPEILSSTMLSLCMKKYIEFEVDENNKNELYVNILENQQADLNKLKTSDLEIYELLKKIGTRFSMKDLEKYAKKHNSSFLKALDRVKSKAEKEQIQAQNYDLKIRAKHDNFVGFGVCHVFIAFFVAFVGIIIVCEFGKNEQISIILLTALLAIINSIIDFVIAGRFSGLTQKGIDEKEQLKGLKKYMEDFSMIDEREVPELAIWEKYLVYATTFGIADKVLKQLKVKYPEFSDEESMKNYSYMYFMSRGTFGTSFINTLNSSVNKAYQSSVAASSASSGGGYGGGFSRWRWRRPAAEVAGGGR